MEKRKKIHALIFLILIITILIRGYFAFTNPVQDLLDDKVGKPVVLKGIISNEPQKKDFSQIFLLKVQCVNENCTISDDIYIKITADKYISYDYGDSVNVSGKLVKPFNFKSNGGRTFDYINYLKKDEIYYEIRKSEIEILDHDMAGYVASKLFVLKQNFLKNLRKVLGEPHAGLAGGLTVGEKSALDKGLIDDFRKSGLIHIIVLSGYNITIIATSIRRLLSFLPRNLGIILGAIGIILFGILVGGGATVVRSCIMALIALFAELLRRDYAAGRALIIAALLMLIQNPLILLYDPSFQLSFLATFGLIALSSPIEKHLGFITEKIGIRSLVASTFATQIFVSPLIFYMMGQLSIVGIFVNILVLPFIPLTMLIIFFTGFLGFISYHISQVVGYASHILLSYELFSVRFFAHLPFAAVEVPAFPAIFVAGFYGVYLALFLKLPSIISQFIFKKKSSI